MLQNLNGALSGRAIALTEKVQTVAGKPGRRDHQGSAASHDTEQVAGSLKMQ